MRVVEPRPRHGPWGTILPNRARHRRRERCRRGGRSERHREGLADIQERTICRGRDRAPCFWHKARGHRPMSGKMGINRKVGVVLRGRHKAKLRCRDHQPRSSHTLCYMCSLFLREAAKCKRRHTPRTASWGVASGKNGSAITARCCLPAGSKEIVMQRPVIPLGAAITYAANEI